MKGSSVKGTLSLGMHSTRKRFEKGPSFEKRCQTLPFSSTPPLDEYLGVRRFVFCATKKEKVARTSQRNIHQKPLSQDRNANLSCEPPCLD